MFNKFMILWNLFRKWTLGLQNTRYNGNSIRLEASSVCQLQCPLCPQRTGGLNIIGRGFLEFINFKKLVDGNPTIRNIELSSWGEIFLNPNLTQILRYAHQKGIALHSDNGVNLNTVDEATLEAVVKFQVKFMRISIDGATPENYQIYRKGGDFNRVIQNIKTINHYKKIYDSKYPLLIWQFILFGHNENEVVMAKEMAQAMDMRFILKENWGHSYSPLKNRLQVNEKIKKQEIMLWSSKYAIWCDQLWTNPQINFDGKLLGCCSNLWGDYGNVFESGLKQCIESEKYQNVIKMLLGRKKMDASMPCYQCKQYFQKIKLLHNPIKHIPVLFKSKSL